MAAFGNRKTYRNALVPLTDFFSPSPPLASRHPGTAYWLSGDGKIVSRVPSAFDAQLKICREEWRRRHPNDYR
jgi:hypothetical protein